MASRMHGGVKRTQQYLPEYEAGLESLKGGREKDKNLLTNLKVLVLLMREAYKAQLQITHSDLQTSHGFVLRAISTTNGAYTNTFIP